MLSLTDTFRHDKRSNYAFVAEFNGDITVLKLEERSLTKVTILKGHSGIVTIAKLYIQ